MDYRRRKQIIIALILTLILVLIGGGVYYKWFYQAPTCFDGRQNQDEGGVDCGGVCTMSCELLTVKNLEVKWAKAVFLKDGVYDVVAAIDNPNPNYGLAKIEYSFEFLDQNDQLLVERKGTGYILPGQEKYIIEANILISKKPSSVKLTLLASQQNDWQRLVNDFVSPDIYIHDKQFQYLDNKSDQPNNSAAIAQASGIIKNNSNFDFNNINVAVILFDDEKNIIGVNKTIANTVLAGEERYFTALWFSPLSGEVKSMEMSADTNLFSDNNFMKRFGEPEKFQQY